MFQWANLIIIALTQKCNLQCKYCFLGDKQDLSQEIMSFKTFKQIIDRIVFERVTFAPDTQFQILLHGGEPLLTPVSLLEKMLVYANAHFKANHLNVILSLQTNGINLTSEYRQILKDNNVEVGVSIDGITNKLRTSNKNSQIIIDNITKGAQEGLSLGTNTVVTKTNVKHILSDLQTLPADLRCTKINTLENFDLNNQYAPSAKEYFINVLKPSILQYLNGSQYPANLADRIVSRYLIYKSTLHSYDNCQSTCQFKYCGGGLTLVSIMPDGMIRLCDHWRGDETFFNPKIGYITEKNFLGLKQINKLIKWIQYLQPLYEICDNCYLADYCIHPCPLSWKKSQESSPKFSCELTQLLYEYCEENLYFIIDQMIKNHKGLVQTTELEIYAEAKNPALAQYKIAILDSKTLKFSHV